MAQILAVAFVLAFVVIFEFSLGPVPWLYMAEIMTDKGLSMAVVLNWITTLAIAIAVPFLIGGPLFIAFGILCCVCGAFSLIVLKETKDLSEAEVQALYSREKNTDYNELDKDQ